MNDNNLLDVTFNDKKLIPAIAQDSSTGEIRMVAYMNEEALTKTVETGFAHYWSRSRETLWKKGETSGHVQHVNQIRSDCDRDVILLSIDQNGDACHTGERNCFFYKWNENDKKWEKTDPFPQKRIGSIMGEIETIVAERDENRPEDSYTTKLFEGSDDKTGEDLVLEKIGEEITELILAAKNDDSDNLIQETGDLLYHLLVLLRQNDVSLTELASVLNERRK